MDPGNPNDPSGTPGPGPDPNQPGWASPTPPAAPQPAPGPPPTAPSAPPPPDQPTAPVAPGMGGPGSPPVRKRRMTWLWILIPTLLIFAAATVVVIVFAIRLIVGPIDATEDYFALLRQGRYATAYNERCESFQSQVSLDEFVNRERVAGPVRDFDIDDEEFERDDDDATTSGTVERGGDTYQVTVRLEKEDGDWKVCRIEART